MGMMLRKISSLRFKPSSFPLALLALYLISFGLLIPNLGFFWDDWEIILLQHNFGPKEMWSFFQGELRPFAAWSFIPFTQILGSNPLYRQIFTLLIRFAAVLSMGWTLGKLWPGARRQSMYAMILFSIYPIFIQQPISVAYQRHWISYSAYFISIGSMIQYMRGTRYKFAYLLLSVLTQVMHLSSLEYFYGLELLRPVLLWLCVDSKHSLKSKVLKTLAAWLPYLFILAIFSYWRIQAGLQMIETAGEDIVKLPNTPNLFYDLLANPVSSGIQFLEVVFQDLVQILFSSWYQTLNPNIIDLNRPFNVFSWAMVILASLLLWFYLKRLDWGRDAEISDKQQFPWHYQGLMIGILAILLGMLPVWSIYQRVSVPGNHADRFGLAAMFGASIVLVALLEWLFKNREIFLPIAVMAGLAVGLQLRVGSEYEWSWTKQERVYWQLYWRAPSILPGTNFLADRDLFSFNRPTFAFNVLYGQPVDGTELAYRFFLIPENVASKAKGWLDGVDLDVDFRIFTYTASTKNSLLIFYEPPETTNCLWILRPEETLNPYLTDRIKEALPLSNLSRIQPAPTGNNYPSEEIFGPELERGWCYYYQKAELARQMQDWPGVVELGEEAKSLGFTPGKSQSNSPQEWLAFIEGYAHQDRWEEAWDFTQSSLKVDSNYRPVFCHLWNKISAQTNDSANKEQVLPQAIIDLECSPTNLPVY